MFLLFWCKHQSGDPDGILKITKKLFTELCALFNRSLLFLSATKKELKPLVGRPVLHIFLNKFKCNKKGDKTIGRPPGPAYFLETFRCLVFYFFGLFTNSIQSVMDKIVQQSKIKSRFERVFHR